MKHSHHCHCGFSQKCQKLRAGKLGLLGGIFVVLHLLYHVAECLILPAVFLALSGHDAEATELSAAELQETTLTDHLDELNLLRLDFYDSFQEFALLRK